MSNFTISLFCLVSKLAQKLLSFQLVTEGGERCVQIKSQPITWAKASACSLNFSCNVTQSIAYFGPYEIMYRIITDTLLRIKHFCGLKNDGSTSSLSRMFPFILQSHFDTSGGDLKVIAISEFSMKTFSEKAIPDILSFLSHGFEKCVPP